MAKKKVRRKQASSEGVVKAEEIRRYCTENPDSGPTAVAEALNTAHGWEISAQYVSTIKSADRRRSGIRGKRGRPAGSTKEITASKLRKAKQLAEELGGVNQARAALDALAELIG